MRRMLIVDDERDICECLQDFFSARGFSVVSAFSGEEALERLGTDAADVILLDILLPGLTGLEVLKRVKEVAPHSRVIMVTGIDEDDIRRQARRFGAEAYITKPFDFADPAWSSILV